MAFSTTRGSPVPVVSVISTITRSDSIFVTRAPLRDKSRLFSRPAQSRWHRGTWPAGCRPPRQSRSASTRPAPLCRRLREPSWSSTPRGPRTGAGTDGMDRDSALRSRRNPRPSLGNVGGRGRRRADVTRARRAGRQSHDQGRQQGAPKMTLPHGFPPAGLGLLSLNRNVAATKRARSLGGDAP